MASKGGPQGCVLSGPSSPRPPQIPPVPVARPDIPVLLPAIRPVLCSESVHKADETSGGIPEGERNETNNLFGRHTGDQQLPGGSKGICSFNQGSIQFPGPNHQRKEITTGALTGGSIFGVSHFNSDYEHLSAVRKDEENSARSEAFVEGGVSVNPADCCFYWDDQCSETSHSNGSHVPSPTPSSGKQSDSPSGFRTSGDETELPQSSGTHCGGQRGVDLVVSSSQEPQCSPNHNPPSGFSDRDRCFPYGMGARCLDQRTWSVKEQELHINALELTAVLLAIQTFTKERKHQHILVRTDNTTAKSYINHIGGTHSPTLNAIALSIWNWCLERHLHLSAEYLPGVENQIADAESRHSEDRCDWMLHPQMFEQINSLMGPLDVDLFASRLTHQLPKFFSWKPDPEAEATDAFTQSWSQIHGYANPPWCLILTTLTKIRREEARIVLVAPVWKTQPWYPLLLDMLTDVPCLLTQREDLVISPSEREFIMPAGVPQLAAWPLSGKSADRVAFQQKLHSWSQLRCVPSQHHLMNPSLGNGTNGVWNGVEIPLRAL